VTLDSKAFQAREGPVQLEVRVALHGNTQQLRIVGELDLASAPLLDRAVDGLVMDGASEIGLDLSEVTFIDSSGLRAVALFAQRCREQKTNLEIVPGPTSVQRLFALTGTLETLPFQLQAPLLNGVASRWPGDLIRRA
jgi:anti-anti-sigma factor